jgi:uncharacterized membrane protein
MATLLAITYPESDRAKQAMESIDWSAFDKLINLKAACWITKEDGKLKVHEHGHPVAGKAALGGALGLLVGGLFAIPIVGIAAGAAVGIHKAREKEVGVDNAFVESIGAQLDSGSSAVFVLVDGGADTMKAAGDLAKFGGTVHSSDLSEDQLSRFQAMLDKEAAPPDDTPPATA